MHVNRIVRTAFVFVIAQAFFSLALSGIAQAEEIYMSVEGNVQGLISSGASPASEGHEDEITVFGFGHNVTIPRDPQSGQPTGQRVHQPLRIFKAFDNSSPLLYNALVTGETLNSVVIKFFRTDQAGRPEHYYTIELEDAVLVDITAAAGADGNGTREILSYTYRKIIWTMEISGTSSSDDWRVPKT
jgi:type VI secretion system secreted protein Hcp